jgi:hypothetical protein
VAIGRDYDDVTPNRGVWKGRAQESIAVAVAIEPASRVPYEFQGWAEPSPMSWGEPTGPASHQASRGAPGAYQFQRNGRPGVRASSYRGQYRHQQGQQQQA